MGRPTKQNKITSPELLDKINPENKRLLDDFLTYLKSIQRSDTTILSYKNDLEIFFVWNLLNNNNKEFVKVSKRDIIAYQSWLINTNGNSPARVRRLKSTLSSLSNFIESILDDEYKDFRPIIRKVENPVNQAVREKTVLSEDQINYLLETLVAEKQYDKACLLALGAYSGRRKKELLRFKVSYFSDENIIYGSLYKTPEKIKTKGRGMGKFLHAYVLTKKFKPYFDLWMDYRKEIGIESEWLFPDRSDPSRHMNPDTLNSWALTFSRILGIPFYIHALRHHFTTELSKSGLPDDVIKSLVGWESVEMVSVYKDLDADEEIGKYFDEDGVKSVQKAKLSDL
jgi:integrase